MRVHRLLTIALLGLVTLGTPALGGVSLDYYLPADTEFDEGIPTPEEFLGYQIGEWHVSHDQLVAYVRELARTSDRVRIEEYARSHEKRPLVVLTITSPENHDRLQQIQQQHLTLSDPSASATAPLEQMPVVAYMGYSIHGNEASGSNAAPLVAYWLAAAQGDQVEGLLRDAVILLDPSYNPDGLSRFTHWANMHRGRQLVADPAHREHTEAWPKGRFNHYWFDLNRDWLLVQHPESQGRLEVFHAWKPNVLTDHHEMQSHRTFFFQPGIPSRNNPLTPKRTFELTAQIAEYHAAALDQLGSLYYTKESFDDFYVGKGSTYPDINGTIGILFEQASVRGHLRQNPHGERTFAFAVRNQVATSLSTLAAVRQLRVELLTHQRDFYTTALTEADELQVKGYVFGADDDAARLHHFTQLLHTHRIQVHELTRSIDAGGDTFTPGKAWVVPLRQPQQRLVRALFERRTSFADSVFYDVSTWTMPLAFDLPYAELKGRAWRQDLAGDQVKATAFPQGELEASANPYAYAFSWKDYYAPRALYKLLDGDTRAYVATRPFVAQTKVGEQSFDYGTIIIPVGAQKAGAASIRALLGEIAAQDGLRIHALATGLTSSGINLGSPRSVPLVKPDVALVVGDGVNPVAAGEMWHLFDQRYHMPVSLVEQRHLGSADLTRYTTIIAVSGRYGQDAEPLKQWVADGGTLVLTGSAVRWAVKDSLVQVDLIEAAPDSVFAPRPYAMLDQDRGAQVIGGAIFSADVDYTHPLGFGYGPDPLPVLRRGGLFFRPADNPYATPVRYSADALLSGYISPANAELLAGSAGVVVVAVGKGRVVLIADELAFRAFWFGTNKLIANAVFFAPIVDHAAASIKR